MLEQKIKISSSKSKSHFFLLEQNTQEAILKKNGISIRPYHFMSCGFTHIKSQASDPRFGSSVCIIFVIFLKTEHSYTV